MKTFTRPTFLRIVRIHPNVISRVRNVEKSVVITAQTTVDKLNTQISYILLTTIHMLSNIFLLFFQWRQPTTKNQASYFFSTQAFTNKWQWAIELSRFLIGSSLVKVSSHKLTCSNTFEFPDEQSITWKKGRGWESYLQLLECLINLIIKQTLYWWNPSNPTLMAELLSNSTDID